MTAAGGHSALWDTLLFLREMPQLLDPAPCAATDALISERLAAGPRWCVCCGRSAGVVFTVDMARPVGSGERDLRWLDTCARCAYRIKSLER